MISSTLREIHEANRASWNAAVIAHNSHKGDQAKFFQGGGSTLHSEELELLGDVKGQRLLHLQCNCGQDTLSLASRGARVVGVDISDQAIDFARTLSLRSGIPAEFHRADLYDWLDEQEKSGEPFDTVFSSYGALRYLSSLDLWAELVAATIKPGGCLVLIDYHPVLYMFDRRGELQNPYSGLGESRIGSRGVIDYVGRSGPKLTAGDYHEGIRRFENPYPHHTFHWGLGEVAHALLSRELQITVLREYRHANGQRYFDEGEIVAERRVLPPPGLHGLPMMFGLRAVK